MWCFEQPKDVKILKINRIMIIDIRSQGLITSLLISFLDLIYEDYIWLDS